MANAVDAMAGVLLGELNRLSKLSAADGEAIAAECMRAKAINETVKTACALGELHLHSQMFRMGKDVDAFQPGALFQERKAGLEWQKPETRKLQAGDAVSDGGRTVINSHGEFETDDGLDDFYARVPNSTKSDDPDDDFSARLDAEIERRRAAEPADAADVRARVDAEMQAAAAKKGGCDE